MPVNTAMTLALMTTDVREDLGDVAATRWTDAVLQRQIDRAVDRYSRVSPLIQVYQVQTFPYTRLYQLPAGWWADQVEYPIGYWPKQFRQFEERLSPLISNPTATPAVSGTAGTLTGAYKWAVTYVTPGGETLPSPLATLTLTNQGASLSAIPTGPAGVIARNIYRTAAGGTQLKLVAQIADNTSTTYTDTLVDGSLGANAPTANTTQGVQLIELQISDSEIPQDTTGWIQVRCATKHELDSGGTTIPEHHWDAIALGAQAYAVQQYGISISDNFEYVDGQFRDRVDDSKAPIAWRQQSIILLERFDTRLKQIANEAMWQRARPLAAWGDKPVRWDRV